jgi:hypothetical protein
MPTVLRIGPYRFFFVSSTAVNLLISMYDERI